MDYSLKKSLRESVLFELKRAITLTYPLVYEYSTSLSKDQKFYIFGDEIKDRGNHNNCQVLLIEGFKLERLFLEELSKKDKTRVGLTVHEESIKQYIKSIKRLSKDYIKYIS